MEKLWETLVNFNTISICVRIALAVLIGGFIGLERSRHGRAAGLRTHVLVCVGSAMATMLGLYSTIVLGFEGDPLRVAAQVVSGIGFLGAGTILLRGETLITGLTTAAGLWATATIGLAVGLGFYAGVVAGFLAVLLTTTFLSKFAKAYRFTPADTYYAEVCDLGCVNAIYDIIESRFVQLYIVPAKSSLPSHVGVELHTTTRTKNAKLLMGTIKNLDAVEVLIPTRH